jgi:hypothetical protein
MSCHQLTRGNGQTQYLALPLMWDLNSKIKKIFIIKLIQAFISPCGTVVTMVIIFLPPIPAAFKICVAEPDPTGMVVMLPD